MFLRHTGLFVWKEEPYHRQTPCLAAQFVGVIILTLQAYIDIRGCLFERVGCWLSASLDLYADKLRCEQPPASST
jgi:hypothetical protein